MSTNETAKPLSEILYHSAEHCVPWLTPGQEDESEEDESFENTYRRWLEGSEHLEESIRRLCFLDLTLFDPRDPSSFFGLLIVPESEKTDAVKESYLKAVRSLNEGEICRTIGSHKVFRAGLPIFKGREGNDSVMPDTRTELGQVTQKYKVVDNHYLESLSRKNLAVDGVKSTDVSLSSMRTEDESFGHPEDAGLRKERVQRASDEPVLSNWDEFIKLLYSEENKIRSLQGRRITFADLLSSCGRELSLVRGVPLATWFRQNGEQTFRSVGQLFLGMTGKNPEGIRKTADTLVAAIANRAFRVNATALADDLGQWKASVQIGHRLPGTLNAITESLLRQQEKGIEVSIPPEAFYLKSTAAVQRSERPSWPTVEEKLSEAEWTDEEILHYVWNNIANRIAYSRVRSYTDPRVSASYLDVPQPILEVEGNTDVLSEAEKDTREAALSILVELMIEAYQHEWVYSILEEKEKPSGVFIKIEDEEIKIANRVHKTVGEKSSYSPLQGSKQAEMIEEICKVTDNKWSVIYPEKPSNLEHGEEWSVRVIRNETNQD